MQASDKGTRLIDEDGLFSLVAAAPDTAPPASQLKAEAAPAAAAIPASNFYGSKAASEDATQAKKRALSASSLAASGEAAHQAQYILVLGFAALLAVQEEMSSASGISKLLRPVPAEAAAHARPQHPPCLLVCTYLLLHSASIGLQVCRTGWPGSGEACFVKNT